MQIQLSWVRREIPCHVKPIAKGTNTLVFADPDPAKVIVFMLCGAKYDWWKECGLITNPDEDHFFRHVEPNLILRRVQAKKLYKAENGSKQKKEIAATIKAMDKIWYSAVSNNYGCPKKVHWEIFWNDVSQTDLPTKELATFCTDYYVGPDLAPRNALVDADGDIVWSDLFCSEAVLDFLHTRKEKQRGYY